MTLGKCHTAEWLVSEQHSKKECLAKWKLGKWHSVKDQPLERHTAKWYSALWLSVFNDN